MTTENMGQNIHVSEQLLLDFVFQSMFQFEPRDPVGRPGQNEAF